MWELSKRGQSSNVPKSVQGGFLVRSTVTRVMGSETALTRVYESYLRVFFAAWFCATATLVRTILGPLC